MHRPPLRVARVALRALPRAGGAPLAEAAFGAGGAPAEEEEEEAPPLRLFRPGASGGALLRLDAATAAAAAAEAEEEGSRLGLEVVYTWGDGPEVRAALPGAWALRCAPRAARWTLASRRTSVDSDCVFARNA